MLIHQRADDHAGEYRWPRAFPCFVRADPRRHAMASQRLANEVGEDVSRPHDEQRVGWSRSRPAPNGVTQRGASSGLRCRRKPNTEAAAADSRLQVRLGAYLMSEKRKAPALPPPRVRRGRCRLVQRRAIGGYHYTNAKKECDEGVGCERHRLDSVMRNNFRNSATVRSAMAPATMAST